MDDIEIAECYDRRNAGDSDHWTASRGTQRLFDYCGRHRFVDRASPVLYSKIAGDLASYATR